MPEQEQEQARCLHCGKSLPVPVRGHRQKKFCCDGHRQAFYQRLHRAERKEAQKEKLENFRATVLRRYTLLVLQPLEAIAAEVGFDYALRAWQVGCMMVQEDRQVLAKEKGGDAAK